MSNIEISHNTIKVNVFYNLYIDNDRRFSHVGYVPLFDLPFTSPNIEKSDEIVSGLIKSLLIRKLKSNE